MVYIRPENVVRSREQIYKITHFICFPLVTASSRPLLQSSLGLLRDNPASACIPSKAFVPLDTLHLGTGFAMSLPTPDRFAQAEKLLQSLDLNSLTRELSKPSLKERSIKERFLDVERSLSLSSAVPTAQPLPLQLTVSGLEAAPIDNQDIMIKTLNAICYDSTSRVSHLIDNLAIIFAAAGFLDLVSMRMSRRIQLKTTGIPLPRVSLVRMALIRSAKWVPSPTQPGKWQKEDPPTIDPRDIVRIFKDFVWAENIRLERLSICPIGLTKDIIETGSDARLVESCSVSLL